MAFDVVDEPSTPTQQRDPGRRSTRATSHAARPRRRRSTTRTIEFERTNGAVDHQRRDLGRRRRPRLHDGRSRNPELGDIEIWELENNSGGWFHPVHIHLIDFKILDRNGKPPFAYELGPKDVVYVGEGETVRVIMQFGPHRGRYMMHCHNLSHEDHDMMDQFEVGTGGHDPIEYDRPKHQPAPDLHGDPWAAGAGALT